MSTSEKKTETSSKGDTTKVLTCSCKHPAQDKLYGQGKRLHNLANKTGNWRCTVCRSEK